MKKPRPFKNIPGRQRNADLSGSTPVCFLLVDGSPIFRALLRRHLEANSNLYRVVGESGTEESVSDFCSRLAPDIIVLDHPLPDGGTASVVQRIAREFPATRCLVLATRGEGVHAAVAAGAHGFVLKSESLEEMDRAIAAIVAGERYISAGSRQQPHGPSLENLSARQRQILFLIASGHSTKSAAETLAISAKTADHHRARLMRSLNVHDSVSLARVAYRIGLVQP